MTIWKICLSLLAYLSIDVKNKPEYFHLLGKIYFSENYCLKRIPRLVKYIQDKELKSLLNDQVSIIMDKLNRLDKVYALQGQKVSGTVEEEFRQLIRTLSILVNGQAVSHGKQASVIEELLKITGYISALYEEIVDHYTAGINTDTFTLLSSNLQEEEQFRKNLIGLSQN